MKKIIGLFFVLALLVSCSGTKGEKYNDLAICLTSNNAKMYGAFWCPHCQKQKKAFGSAFEHVTYIECDPRDDEGQPDLCLEKEIEGYPTWILKDGTRIEGQVKLQELAEKTSCPYPEEEKDLTK